MALAGFFFVYMECYLLQVVARVSHERSESQSTLSTGMVKLLELVLCLAYVIYDAAMTETPGVGTTVLVVVSCLAEVLLLCFEGYTVLKYEMGSAKVSPSKRKDSEHRVKRASINTAINQGDKIDKGGPRPAPELPLVAPGR